ncbi:MAG: hydantoinase B/oxoprolinase family protein [Pseudomonadota bacterium]|nr:hydantoinase B/oxoprolinase family protein [Pseudomonadota bacterium]
MNIATSQHGIDVDPVRIEILRHALVAASEEMGVSIARTSRSNTIREMLDFSTAIFDVNGENVAQAARIPVHLNTMAPCLQAVLADHLPASDWNEGDVVIVNDPYCGGQHLPDITVFKAIFFEGEHIGFSGTMAHHADVGGGAAGSYNSSAADIFAEGIRIPPLKIYERGELNTSLMTFLSWNVRGADHFRGDLNSQIASLEIGARNVVKLAGKYGVDFMKAAYERILDQSEVAMRNAIRAVPDGEYRFEEWVDDDGVSDQPFCVAATVIVDGDKLVIDMTGSSPQVAGSVNCTLNISKSCVFYAVMAGIGGGIAANSGCYRPVEVVAPEGTVVNCLFPAPVVNRILTGHRIVTAIFGALASALPDRIPAAYYSITHCLAVEGLTDDGARPMMFDCEVGGWGGAPQGDGASGFSCGLHNISAVPLEMIEAGFPIRFHTFALRPDSGGEGKHRGGLGLVKDWELTGPSAVVAASSDRTKFAPYGLAGGGEGKTGKASLTRKGKAAEPLPSKFVGLKLERGDRLRIETPGGGGWGPASERDEAARDTDRRLGYTTR